MRLSTRSRYGTRLILDIAIHGELGPVRILDVAKRQYISVKYLEKLIRILKKAGYITSKRGPKGGHVLAKPLKEISVGEVVRILEGDKALTRCAETGKVCTKEVKCPMHRVWVQAGRAMFDKLDSVTFDELLQDFESSKCEEVL